MELLKKIALSLWTTHRKKFIAFVLGLIFAGMAALGGIPIEEIKEAAQEASRPAAAVQALPAPVQLPAAEHQ